MTIDAYHPGYRSPVGIHSIPTYTYVDNLGQTHTGSGGVYKMDRAGQLVPATVSYSSPDGKVGTYSWSPSSLGTSTPSSINGDAVASVRPTVTNTKTRTPAETAYDKAIATLLGGSDTAKETSTSVLGRVASAGGDVSAARGAASGISAAMTGVSNAAMSLGPYADILRNLGLGTIGIGDAIIRGDTSVGGLSAEFLNALGLAGDAALKISPDRYVSQSAADVQSSFDNAKGQAERDLSRRGVSATSGAYGALQRQFATALATAVAATKTRARQVGLTERASALASRAALYKDALATGAALQQQGAQNVGTAADIVSKQGDLFATSGSLANAQVGAYANIAGVEVNLGNLELSNAKLVQDSVNSVAAMQAEMAKYYGGLETAKLPTKVHESGYKGGQSYYGTTTTTRG